MKKKDGRKAKEKHDLCGNWFSPAGYATHIKHCTGPGYKPNHTHSVPGSHNKKVKAKPPSKPIYTQKDTLIPCRKGCGRLCKPQGQLAHERACQGPGYIPGYSAKRRIERRIGVKSKAPVATANYEAFYAPKAGVEMAYEMFKDDAEMFSIMVHLMAAVKGYDVMYNLEAARKMLDRKMELLEKP